MGMLPDHSVLPPDVRLALTIKLLAGASYLDLKTRYCVGASTIYNVFRETCDALIDVLALPGLPSSVVDLKTSSLRFKTSRQPHNPLCGCVGALDGISVKIKTPASHERQATYYCRKGYYALPVQVVCDCDY